MKAEFFLKSKNISKPTYEGVRLVDSGMNAYRIVDLLNEYAEIVRNQANEAATGNEKCHIQNVMPSHLFLHTHGDGSDGNEWGVLGIYYRQEDALNAANNYEHDSDVETWDVK